METRAGREVFGYIGYKVIIPPKYENALPFSEGLARVEEDKRIYFIDTDGKIRIKTHRNRIYDDYMYEGLIRIESNNGFGFVNATGNIVVRPNLEDASLPANMRIAIKKNGHYGIIDTKGKSVLKPMFDFISRFSEGFAIFMDSGLRGYMDIFGNTVIKPSFLAAGNFFCGLAKVLKPNRKHTCFINKKGEEVLQTNKYDWIDDFCFGMAIVRKEDKYGYINMSGEQIVAPTLKLAYKFSGLLAKVKTEEGITFINQRGEELKLEHKLKEATDFNEGLSAVEWVNDKWGIINTLGEFVVSPRFIFADKVVSSIAPICDYEGWGFIKLV